jgi:D-alanyl-lipoteichoic acid acyltransferase DltB (MBOAT superfamily)
MLFNSYEFMFLFLPLTAAVFFVLSGAGWARAAAGWLGLASVFFYGYWSPRFLPLLLGSIAFNYVMGSAILVRQQGNSERAARPLLVVAVGANLLVLAYFKYANFFVDSINAAGLKLHLGHIVLPIGISFFTFTQIAYLVDTYQGKVKETNFLHYLLFVTYFPHLIAGPVLHHKEMMPQFALKETYGFNLRNFSIGVAFFLIGLFKKVVLADGIQPFVGPVFEAQPGYVLSGVEAWGGALAYTLQLYFDFSGYSDMAIGLAKMLNVDLPLNFDSPYKAKNIVDFWRCWHMTLSRFLRDYLYIPLGGNRNGRIRRHVNLLLTMLLGGLWHGAGWTFVIWGALHGIYLVTNHAWRSFRELALGHDLSRSTLPGRYAAVALTFLAVVVAWVFFRATSIEAALRILSAMAGSNGWILPLEWKTGVQSIAPGAEFPFADLKAFAGTRQVLWTAALLFAALVLPNSQMTIKRAAEFLTRRAPAFPQERLAWAGLGSAGLLLFLLAAINGSRGVSEFIYFNF